MTPTVGRIVHYTNLGDADGKFPPEIIAAIITKVHGVTLAAQPNVALTIFYPTGFFQMDKVAFTDEKAGTDGARGKWAWPERV